MMSFTRPFFNQNETGLEDHGEALIQSLLPDELLVLIFSYFSLPELIIISLVCHRWHAIAADKNLKLSQVREAYFNFPWVIAQNSWSHLFKRIHYYTSLDFVFNPEKKGISKYIKPKQIAAYKKDPNQFPFEDVLHHCLSSFLNHQTKNEKHKLKHGSDSQFRVYEMEQDYTFVIFLLQCGANIYKEEIMTNTSPLQFVKNHKRELPFFYHLITGQHNFNMRNNSRITDEHIPAFYLKI